MSEHENSNLTAKLVEAYSRLSPESQKDILKFVEVLKNDPEKAAQMGDDLRAKAKAARAKYSS